MSDSERSWETHNLPSLKTATYTLHRPQLLLAHRTFSAPLRFVFPRILKRYDKVWECILFMIEQNGLFTFGDESNIVYNKENGNNV